MCWKRSNQSHWLRQNNGPRLFAQNGPIRILFCCFVAIRFTVVRTIFEVGRRFLSSHAAQSALIQAGKEKKWIRKEVEDWTCGGNCRALQRLTSYRPCRGVGASVLPGAPASEWTFKIPGFWLWKRRLIPRLRIQVGIVEEKYRKIPFFP